MSMQIDIFLDVSKMTEEMATQSIQKTAAFIRNAGKQFVRKDTHALANSGRANQVGPMEFQVVFGGVGIPYAAAQEFGRPDLPNYGFTPYARPAAALSQKDPQTKKNVLNAVREARKKARVRRSKRVG